MSVYEGQIYSLSKKLDDLQKKYFPGIEIPIEFHSHWIRTGKGQFRSFSPEERENIISDVYSILEKEHFPNVIAFATVLDITAVINPAQVTRTCFENICQNFNLNLYHAMKISQAKGMQFSKGLVIIDRGREKQYRQLFSEFKSEELVQKHLANIVDIPYFAACSDTRMLQYADFIANAAWRYYEKDDSSLIDKIIHLFYRGPKTYPVPGLNHITKKTCECYSCKFKKTNRIE
jgi:hypothetical protein